MPSPKKNHRMRVRQSAKRSEVERVGCFANALVNTEIAGVMAVNFTAVGRIEGDGVGARTNQHHVGLAE